MTTAITRGIISYYFPLFGNKQQTNFIELFLYYEFGKLSYPRIPFDWDIRFDIDKQNLYCLKLNFSRDSFLIINPLEGQKSLKQEIVRSHLKIDGQFLFQGDINILLKDKVDDFGIWHTSDKEVTIPPFIPF